MLVLSWAAGTSTDSQRLGATSSDWGCATAPQASASDPETRTAKPSRSRVSRPASFVHSSRCMYYASATAISNRQIRAQRSGWMQRLAGHSGAPKLRPARRRRSCAILRKLTLPVDESQHERPLPLARRRTRPSFVQHPPFHPDGHLCDTVCDATATPPIFTRESGGACGRLRTGRN
jgi:hypothetical protein